MATVASRIEASPSSRTRVASAVGGVSLLVATGAAGEGIIAEGPRNTGELALDTAISHHHEAVLTTFSRALDLAFSPLVGPLVVAVVAVILFVRAARTPAAIFALGTAGLWLTTAAGKLLFARPRPTAAGVHALVVETKADSFPSGHTALAAAIVAAGTLAILAAGRSPRPALLIGVPSVLVVAASRLYLGAHFLADVTASILFVTALSLVAYSLLPQVKYWLNRTLNKTA